MRIKLCLVLFCVILNSFFVIANEKDSLSVIKKEKINDEFGHLQKLNEKFLIQNVVKVTSPEFNYTTIEEEFSPTPIDVSKAKVVAKSWFEKIKKLKKWVSSLKIDKVEEFPVGIRKELNGVEYQLGFVKAKFTKDYTELTVFARLILPQTDEEGKPIELYFGADNVRLSHDGGIVGQPKLVLLGDVFMPFNAGNWLFAMKGGLDYKTGNVNNKTYVTIDCDGINEIGITGEVQFSRNIILPVDEKGNTLPDTRPYIGADNKMIEVPNRVRGNIKAIVTDWSDLLVEIDISPFVLASQPDKFVFTASRAVFDFSDLRTEGVQFPKFYEEDGLLVPDKESWRGVYVKSLKVGLPEVFKTKQSIVTNDRVKFEASNLIIDSYGVSGSFEVENLFTIDAGRTSKSKSWAYSVDKLNIDIGANQLIGANFEGEIVLPISSLNKKKKNNDDKISGLAYVGLISEDEYSLSVSPVETLDFDIFSAKAQLLPNSSVELKVIDGNFRPKAVLNGNMSISASNKTILPKEGKETVDFKGIKFENLVLQTESPIIQADYFGYNGSVKLANFPVTINDIAFKSTDAEAGIEFDLLINLMDKGNKGFSADTHLGIYGKYKEEGYRQEWDYDRIELSKINLEANLGAIQVKGALELMEDDEVYGDGFLADVQATFGSFGPIKSKAIFGKKDFRYWYIDAAVHGLKIQTGPFQINGFAGGATYKMSRKPNAGSFFNDSGLSYVPNEDNRLGVKAMVFGAIGDESAMAISAGFDIEFNGNAGVNRMGFYGEAQIMKSFSFSNPTNILREKLSKLVENEKIKKVLDNKIGRSLLKKASEEYEPDIVGEAEISAKIGMDFDFVNDTFHAALEIYVDTAGGVIKGRASNGRAGYGVVHVSPDEWYVHMGTPTDRLGLKMDVGPISIKSGGYFMMGDYIPGSPPPPPIVASILGVDANSLDYNRDENALGEGRGFAFGTDFSVDTGDLKFAILYARFQAGLGFDIMLKNYGKARCRNTGDEIGINGWYANGQAYAYLQGELGIRFKVFGKKKKIPIIKGSAAILMQGKGPNPYWFKGYAAGKYNLLGGLVKGKYRFKVTIGEECEIDNASPVGGIKMIADLTPKNSATDVDVFMSPQATFSLPVNREIVIPEDGGDMTYKVVLEKFTLTDESGIEIVGRLDWGSNMDRVTYVSDDVLPSETKIKALVEVSFQEKINGAFQTILENGQKFTEIEERTFITGNAPKNIPLSNIQYSYPVVDQQLLYSDEHPTGYIQLIKGQDYLFDNNQWKSTLRYIDSNGNQEEFDFKYSNQANRITYALPKVSKDTKYQMSIVSASKGAKGKANNQKSTTTTNFDDDNTLSITKNIAQNVFREGEIDRLTYDFKTSVYKTFKSKVKDLDINNNSYEKINSLVINLVSRIDTYEGFGLVELKGNKFSENKPLITIESDLKDAYFNRDINPVLYQKYPEGSKFSVSRDYSIYGYVPKKAVPVIGSYLTSLENNVDSGFIQTSFPFRYNLAQVYYEDFESIQDRVRWAYVKGLGVTPQELSIISERFKFILYGKYGVKLQYILPGGIKGTSATYKYTNPIK
ncbi:hypothetical protein IWQ47_002126 [Aquimarina sp. EL_43]|uniref:hypothetical protein n=1 Tax=unclassified Aquimarina TaxID=2627091 RepID=UPI001A21006B|nr:MULTISPECIES: hypothetical protein [unclassified Aquimarina]MBG6130650.1 hypothetical protein [Aquimarina sp. EL_35]MBG6151204.1 hypothetical protein [Aquimarina sp. EL_32]MBG6169052.1 hypothetical protein [Aquimarina sp. EL_43]